MLTVLGNRESRRINIAGGAMAWKEQNHWIEGIYQLDPFSRPVDFQCSYSQNLDHLSNLRILSIQSNRLTNLSGLSSLKNLEEVYVSHNAITDLSGLESNTSLRVLDISNNQVSKLEHLSTLSNLEELWASNNQLSSFEEVERELKDKKNLETVYFEGNPLQTRGPAVYRNKVRLAVPHIKQIDASKSLFFFHLMMNALLTW